MSKVKGAILIGILGSTALAIIVEAVAKVGPSGPGGNPHGWSLNVPALPKTIVGTPDLSLLGKFNVLGAWGSATWLVALMFVFTLLLTGFFDTMGTMVAVGQEGELLDEAGMPPRTREILLVDSIAAAAGGAASTSSNTSYIESAAGVAEGADRCRQSGHLHARSGPPGRPPASAARSCQVICVPEAQVTGVINDGR